LKKLPRPTTRPFWSNNRKLSKSKKKSRKLLNIITRNVERKPKRLLRRSVSRTRKRRRSKDSENNKKKLLIVKLISMLSVPNVPWKKLIEKTVPENLERPQNNKEFNKNCMRPGSSKCLRKREEWLSRPSKREMSFREFFLSRSNKESKSSKFRESVIRSCTRMPNKLENKSNSRKKLPNKVEPSSSKKAENSSRNSNQRKLS